MSETEQPLRWRRRAGVAGLLRAAVFIAPVLASVAAAWVVRPLLPHAGSLPGTAAHLAALAAVSTVVLLVVDRIARRALPLVTLLNLSMLFPDQAPSRVRVAREAVRRRPIEEQLERVRDAGADPGAVAREILTLVAALSRHDRPTRGHAERVRMFTDLLATQLKVPERDRDLLRWAAILHDIGKLRIPTTLLNKPGKPTEDEWTLLKAHPLHGAEIAEALLPWLGEWGSVIVQHHERYDGTGYPTGLAGAGIGLGGRIVSVADAYDVMTAARAYKRPVSRSAALAELVKFSGSQFDPMVVRAMVAVGAPRLRRAQGVLAWLADIPLVATGSVPAATVARVVGAGALATGAVTGGVPPVSLDHPPARVTAVAAAADRAADRAADPSTPAASGDSRETAEADRLPTALPSAEPERGRDTARSAKAPVTAETAETTGSPEGAQSPAGSGSAGTSESGSGDGSGSGSGSGTSSGSGGGSRGGTSGTGGGTAAVGDVLTDTVDTVTGTVDNTLDDPVGTVTGVVDGATTTVGDTVQDPVGTVGKVLKDPVGTVGGVLGGGGSTPSPSPSPSPTKTGLLGGILGR